MYQPNKDICIEIKTRKWKKKEYNELIVAVRYAIEKVLHKTDNEFPHLQSPIYSLSS